MSSFDFSWCFRNPPTDTFVLFDPLLYQEGYLMHILFLLILKNVHTPFNKHIFVDSGS